MITTSLVTPEFVPQVWGKAAPYLEEAINISGGRATVPETLVRCLSGNLQLWLAYDTDTLDVLGSFATSVDTYPDAKLLTVQLLGGEQFDQWIDDCQDKLVIWAAANECRGIQLFGREGWVRKLKKLGWQKKFVTCEYTLDPEEHRTVRSAA